MGPPVGVGAQGSCPGEGAADCWREVVLLAVVGDERDAVAHDDVGAEVMREGPVGVDGEADRQVGVEVLELAEQVADGQVVGHGNLRKRDRLGEAGLLLERQWESRRSRSRRTFGPVASGLGWLARCRLRHSLT